MKAILLSLVAIRQYVHTVQNCKRGSISQRAQFAQAGASALEQAPLSTSAGRT